MNELLVKVSAPFAGIDDLGFTARYPVQELSDPVKDIPFVVEGPPRPMAILLQHLGSLCQKQALLPSLMDADEEAYTWTYPVQLADGLVIMAFRAQSYPAKPGVSISNIARRHAWNLLRPTANAFLRDCVRLCELRLSDQINFRLSVPNSQAIDLDLSRTEIIASNGDRLLYAL